MSLNFLEWIAAGLGLATVGLVARRSMWNYPFGLAMVLLYAVIFWSAQLYSDVLLQIFFFVLQAYGWFNWRSASDEDGVPVGWLGHGERVAWIAATVAGSLLWGLMMARYTNAALPYADAGIAGMSVVGQWLQSRRRVDCWLWWIAVDALASLLVYPMRGLYVTAALYGVFLLISVWGLYGWARQARDRMGATI